MNKPPPRNGIPDERTKPRIISPKRGARDFPRGSKDRSRDAPLRAPAGGGYRILRRPRMLDSEE